MNSSSAQTITAPSVWKNESGSILKLDNIDGNQLEGEFTNKASGTFCKDTPYPMSGLIDNNKLTFTVIFQECSTITVWNANLENGIIKSIWTLSYVLTSRQNTNGQLVILSGSDTFEKQ